jgi:predicted transcriptional regulator of viral defense system
MAAQNFIDRLMMSGRYHFTSPEARKALGGSADAAKLALNRLRHQGLIASPSRGFYVIVPPEYRSIGCLAAEQFIPALMAQREQSYYAGLLTAAQYYGAAHHRPQEFQVFLEKNRRPIKCGKVRVAFIARKDIREVPVKRFNTARGEVAVSTPEATAIDLAGYPKHAGGLDQVATILAELAEQLDPALLADAARTAPVPWAQRLGHLLEIAEAPQAADGLREYVATHAREYTPLVPGKTKGNSERSPNWKLIVNARVEPDL